MRVLIAEDDVPLAQGIARVLREAGFSVDCAHAGDRADFLAQTETYDAIVLDLGLPMRDGLSLLRDWREAGLSVPVLILTARSRWPDKAAGFAAGADDYVTKPFEPLEIVLRIQALVRRSRGEAHPLITVGNVSVDTLGARVVVDGEPVTLTAQEYKLLEYLFLARGRVVSRSELVEHVYERDRDPDSNVVDVLIGRIRRRLGAALIETVRGRGFVVRSDARA
ncbi:response regulator transcription factor [Sinimarinibacterium sp. NLF-5-8]|uniref:response regulator transcription factor n=1 Tax=Sinimarinibacterium sp. NLF-5-8 TaxID=2698684 RepID=UPI00137BBDD6|nr:response regulator transcription factor [Sinimarinibacterium sp. NLF-5-8]QHS11143.1 response regulator transcription factor [Sinimarinibacterium sp. NLF-5-8]